ncbi:MAG TPA: hypothetical protein VHV47_09730 [Opitutaceae bacterium]|jgi:hypothetical protein|nr:hypothetical protein [Opitutaceae bacterium]
MKLIRLTKPTATALLLAAFPLFSPAAEEAPASKAKIDLAPIGLLSTRSARQITSSPWSIGGETVDRDYTSYEAYKGYLGTLGAKTIRLQAGWAKTERRPGVYSWDWLDSIVNDALAQGIAPWLELSYGNPIYPGGGDTGLGGGFPASPMALSAWDRWVAAVVDRYRDRVSEWEIWNEPDGGGGPPEKYAELYVRTARTILSLQPHARIWALALAGHIDYADSFFSALKTGRQLALVQRITLHGYPRNPDDVEGLAQLRKVLAKYGLSVEIRMGETGAPSRFQAQFALRDIAWTENLQAKWDLRRMLAFRAENVSCSLFTIADMRYTDLPHTRQKGVWMNFKGLLATNPDLSVSRAKPAYAAAQRIFTLFDDQLEQIAPYPYSDFALRHLALTGYRRRGNGAQLVAYWFNDAPPDESNQTTALDLTLPAGRFSDPVLIDLRTGIIYAIPNGRWRQTDRGAQFTGLPAYDSPIVLADHTALP